MEPDLSKKDNSLGNFEVDYVVLFRYADVDQSKAIQQFKYLIRALTDVGLQTEVRPGRDSSLLVFVRAPAPRLATVIHRSRVRDWLYGIRHTQPDPSHKDATEPETEAERLVNVYNMITGPSEEGGAGITPKYKGWEHVEAIFPLYDKQLNKAWIKNWSRKTFLTDNDLDEIHNRHGERIAFYFAFLQSYFTFLFFPAAFGFACWVLLGHFSLIYAVVNCIACLVFVEFWKRRESDLQFRWQVKGVSAIRTKRKEFQHEKEVVDPVTGEKVLVFSAVRRLWRQLLQVPFALITILSLGSLIATCFAIEIFLSEIYAGPFKTYLVFIPTVLLSLLVPAISRILTTVATRLTVYENYETQDAYDEALTQKIFVLNFITSYLPIFLTAFVYVPFGSVIVPYLDVFGLTLRPGDPTPQKAEGKFHPKAFQIDPSRLRKQVIYFTVTAQIVNLGLETIMPVAKQRLFRKYKEMSEKKQEKASPRSVKIAAVLDDAPGEAAFLARVRDEAEQDEYDVTTDLREMCVQFGYLTLFSPIWPLAPISFLINNWIELRSDFVKICSSCRRPTPFRADSIGPWLDSLAFLTWLGSLTSAALVYMFSNDGEGPNGTPSVISGWALLLSIFFSEHLYLLFRWGVQVAISKVDTAASRKEHAQRYLIRKAHLDNAMQEEEAQPSQHRAENEAATTTTNRSRASSFEPGAPRSSMSVSYQQEIIREEEAKISRESLEDDARRLSLHDIPPSSLFWARQRGYAECAQVGVVIMQAVWQPGPEEKKVQ
ncbi:hypothetical protein AJ80_06906 [Polytolypa hystricis UAMH7299]|uniref:Anoctamin dimerisation domain-containing protein n=1 Tax=Polytolypa hystricis (strain UAMH7299) TaxID=1447883 RepID=A0A2B7XT49_POLH7|nr:hypothetical protein AJ80_06906 [Polytolypa hystricis UAMH7299]